MSSSYGSIPASQPDGTQGANSEQETSPLLENAALKNGFRKEDSAEASTHASSQGSWLSQLVFGWMGPLLELGNAKQKLDPADLDMIPLPPDCQTDELASEFERQWQQELSKPNPRLALALFRAFGWDFAVGGFVLKFVHDCCIFVGPQVLNAMIRFLRDPEAPISQGLMLTLTVTLSQLAMSFCLRHYFFKCYKFGLMLRTAVVVAVYKKALVLSSGERSVRTLGEITNLMSIDAQRLQDLTNYVHAIWYSFLQIGLAIFFLWQQLGASSLGGVVVIIFMMPVTRFVATWMGGMQKRLMKARDARVEVNSEVLGAMKVIKLQAWEESFQKRILGLRSAELQQLLRYIIANSFSTMLWTGTPLAVALATFATYVFTGHKLEVASALTALALFDILRFPLFMLPQIINRIVEAGISLARLRSFLLCDEHHPLDKGKLIENGILLENVSCAYDSKKPRLDGQSATDPQLRSLLDKDWEISLLKSQLDEAEKKISELMSKRTISYKESLDPDLEPEDIGYMSGSLLCLKRVNFHVQPGQLVCIVGGVGCGKSSMINSILGEVRKLSGTMSCRGSLSYFPQSPFIMNASVRSNILFSHVNEPFDQERYDRAIQSCALEHDLNLLPAGDSTEIGERGITLSGGQKARVALARAVYHNADISVIDDALSAVDAHVAQHLFNECIVKELFEGDRSRSVVLATNALQYLNHPRVDRIVVLREGRVVEEGSYGTLTANKESLFSHFLSVIEETGVVPSCLPDLDDPVPAEKDPDDKQSPSRSVEARGPESVPPGAELKPEEKKAPVAQLMTVEERATGHVGADVYFTWARAAGGVWIPFVIVIAFGFVESINVLSKWYLTYWSEHGEDGSQFQLLGVYAAINLFAMVASFFRLVLIMLFGLRASRELFAKMLAVILEVPMSFFDTTPVGRIINRFSKDIYEIDEKLMMALRSYLATLLTVVSTIVVVSGVTPIFTACLIPIIIYYALQQNYFTVTYRELKRLDSVNRSPIYALLSESVEGTAVIRAFSAENSLTSRLVSMLDTQQTAYFLTCAAQCWLAVRLEMVGTVIVSAACLCAVWEHVTLGGDEVFAGLAGLSISFALSVTQSLNWSVRMASDLEASMVAVERIKEYCNLGTEADRATEADAAIAEQWPTQGHVRFENVTLRYRPGLPLVLKGLNIDIPGRSKVGVVGRTGAGKSTLATSLLRIVELESGRVTIDGIDIKSLGLARLRSSIAIIPQDPVLFSGTIRSNLDPFGDFQDADLIEVLTRVGLYAVPSASAVSLTSLASASISSLEDPVKEGGNNFSVGQRQLMVIARALLSKASIVICDEATASTDADTDARIQKVMRSEFAQATCITVAHRINTIMDSDFILVMDDGKAAEFDSPRNLLAKDGMFRDLVKAASSE